MSSPSASKLFSFTVADISEDFVEGFSGRLEDIFKVFCKPLSLIAVANGPCIGSTCVLAVGAKEDA